MMTTKTTASETGSKKELIQCLEIESQSGNFRCESNECMAYAIRLLKGDTCDMDTSSIITALTHTMYLIENNDPEYKGKKIKHLFAEKSKNGSVIIYEEFTPQTKSFMEENSMGKCITPTNLPDKKLKTKELLASFWNMDMITCNPFLTFQSRDKPTTIKDDLQVKAAISKRL